MMKWQFHMAAHKVVPSGLWYGVEEDCSLVQQDEQYDTISLRIVQFLVSGQGMPKLVPNGDLARFSPIPRCHVHGAIQTENVQLAFSFPKWLQSQAMHKT
eukprot:TRINITY_DN3990_c0_g2_i1.p3 TRINITY_DN3990_c0_g2~~TRINITY_DN3990_c0_g2_i1.p3  ORF type:complete len:100 (-),score=7.22 TRINITY_DN3990_c0_g2_i1:8-307(-)